MSFEYLNAQFMRYAPLPVEEYDQIRIKIRSERGESNWLNITPDQVREIESILLAPVDIPQPPATGIHPEPSG